jgi:hypothetical protein
MVNEMASNLMPQANINNSGLLEFYLHTFNEAKTLKENNISNELTRALELLEKASTPLDMLYEGLKQYDTSIINLVNLYVRDILKSHAENITNAFRSYENSLHYTVFLKDYSLENWGSIYEMFLDYEFSPIGQRYPVYLEILDINEFSPEDVYQFEVVI